MPMEYKMAYMIELLRNQQQRLQNEARLIDFAANLPDTYGPGGGAPTGPMPPSPAPLGVGPEGEEQGYPDMAESPEDEQALETTETAQAEEDELAEEEEDEDDLAAVRETRKPARK